MKKMYYIKAKKNKRKTGRKIMVIIIAVVLLFVLIDAVIEHMIYDTAVSVSRRIASQTVNEAVAQVLSEGEFEYTDFVEVISNPDGAVQSVSAKSDCVNMFKSMLGKAVMDTLENKKTSEINIPIGSLTDIGVLYGRGPNISIKLRLYGDMTTELKSTFVSVGINQTKHSIMCKVSANIAIITPSFTTYTCVETEYMLAETVIVGDIPDSYTDVNGDDSGIIGKIFDYADIE